LPAAAASDRLRIVRRLLAFLLALIAPSALACGGDIPCPIEGGEYRFLPPASAREKPPGLLIFVHGHRSSAAEMLAYRELVEAAAALDLVLVAPQGQNDTWATPGAPSRHRDEVPFLRRMLDDLPLRLAYDPRRVVLSGFSQGASVVWHVACAGEPRIAAYIPIAGVWWRPMPETCPGPPAKLLHIHGLADPVMPMAGRNLRDLWRQGDVREAVATMTRHNACTGPPARREAGELACEAPTDCARGGALALCLHRGDHHTNPRWLLDNRAWIDEALR
jgi:polyhydroxybutyrate depolymerase